MSQGNPDGSSQGKTHSVQYGHIFSGNNGSHAPQGLKIMRCPSLDPAPPFMREIFPAANLRSRHLIYFSDRGIVTVTKGECGQQRNQSEPPRSCNFWGALVCFTADRAAWAGLRLCISVQPLADIVTYYSCQHRDNKGEYILQRDRKSTRLNSSH